MNAYEIMLMLDPEVEDERQNEILSRMRELVEKGGGAWQSHEPWGRRKLAYEIDKKTEAHYHLVQFDAEPVTLDESDAGPEDHRRRHAPHGRSAAKASPASDRGRARRPRGLGWRTYVLRKGVTDGR